MALVDYSDSESDSEIVPSKPRPAAPKAAQNPPSASAVNATTNKKPVHKIVDSSNPGRIIVSLPSASSATDSQEGNGDNENNGPPAKRARIGGTRSSAFVGFSSFLPAPKNPKPPSGSSSGAINKSTSRSSSSGLSVASRPPVSLKTGSEAAFSRDLGEPGSGQGLGLPPPINDNGPSIPAGQKPADEVKLVGKPLMFRPLSVARRPTRKIMSTAHKTPPTIAHVSLVKNGEGESIGRVAGGDANRNATGGEGGLKKPEKLVPVSLFTLEPEDNDPGAASELSTGIGVYEPMFPPNQDVYSSVSGPHFSASSSDPSAPAHPAAYEQQQPQSLDSIADSIGLSARDRRALFGRTSGSNQPSLANVRNVNMDAEYAANQAALASGELQAVQHNPVRGIAPGKHSLRQLVNAVANQRDALEESFARGKSNQREAGARYGWK